MRFRRALTSSLILLASSCGFFARAAEPANFDELFRAGLAAEQSKDFEKATQLFRQAWDLDHRNTAAMTNLGLAEFQRGDKGRAIAWFRRSLAFDPRQTEAANGLKYALSQLEIKEIPHRIETIETLHEDFLQSIFVRHVLGLTGLLLLVFGWFLIAWLGQRRRAIRADEPPPAFPWTLGLLGTLFVVSVILLSLKLYDASLDRGTVVGKVVPVRSLPGENGVSLFELHEGFEVLIGDVNKDWVQVTYPGALTGWIPKENLISE